MAVAGSLIQGPAQAKVFDFSLTGLDDSSITGSGTLTTGAGPSPYTVTAANGTITDPSGTFTINGLSTYAGADNLLYYPATGSDGYVDFGDISFTTSGVPDFNIGGGGSEGLGVVLNDSVLNPAGNPGVNGSYNISLTVTSAPELSTWAMLGLGFAGLGFAGYRGRKAVSIAA